MVSGLLQQHVDFRKTKQVNMISGTTQQLLDFQKTNKHLRMMTVKLMAMATLMSTFITESMCLISIIMRLYYSFVVLRIAKIYGKVSVELYWAQVPSSLGK